MSRRSGLLLFLLAGLAAGCRDEKAKQDQCVQVICFWNPDTQRFDRDCRHVAPDGGGPCPDAGPPDQAASTPR